MIQTSPMILVNGANGKLGRTVMGALDAECRLAGVRRPSAWFENALLIDDAGKVAATSLHGVEAVINCAGRVHGTARHVHDANVAHAVSLAETARDAGVRRFVQVSSFSIYGAVEDISADTSDRPSNDYGRSKLAAEHALFSLATPDFSVVSLRLPFMFDREQPALVARTIGLFARLPFVPAPPGGVCRSMLTYGDAAALLIQAAGRQVPAATLAAADPTPFTFEMLVAVMRRHGLPVPRFVTVPRPLVALAVRVTPTVSRRLFLSNILDPDANWALKHTLPFGIERELDAVAAAMSGGRGKRD